MHSLLYLVNCKVQGTEISKSYLKIRTKYFHNVSTVLKISKVQTLSVDYKKSILCSSKTLLLKEIYFFHIPANKSFSLYLGNPKGALINLK